MFSFFDKGKCFFGAHDLGAWKTVATNPCRQIRVCKRSGCKEKETKEEHIWGIWTYGADHSCEQVRTCPRCKKEEKGGKLHIWNEWKYVTLDPWQQYITRLKKIRHVLATRFDTSEVKEICFGLGIDIENLAGDTKLDKTRELVKQLELHHRLDELVQVAKKNRPEIYWDEMEISGAILERTEEFSIEHLSWEYDTSKSCNQERSCSRCDAIERRDQHLWGVVEYESPSSCETAKFCKRCGQKQSDEPKHQWGEWVKSTKECKEIRTCQRCRKIEIGRNVPHEWRAWEFETPVSCVLVRTCMHCGNPERDAESQPHKWGEWNYESPVSCRIVRVCTRCTWIESNEEIKHKWSQWEYEKDDSCKMIRTCQRCDSQETITAKHRWEDWAAIAPLSPLTRSCKRCKIKETSVSGVWTGLMNLETTYFSDLYLEEADNLVKGILVLAYYDDELLTIIRQPVEGKIEGKEIDLSGVSYSFVKKGSSKGYKLDRIVAKLSTSGSEIKGKVPSFTSGTIELSFARTDPFSKLNVSGLWDGIARWADGQEDRWDLFIVEGSSVLKGVLIVTVIRDNTVTSVVEQEVIGKLSNQNISFNGTSGKLVYDSGKKYFLDSFSGMIINSEGTIQGDIVSGDSTGTVTLTLARNMS